MSKAFRTYMIATARPTAQLDALNRLGCHIYSKTVSLAFKVHAQKGFWLSNAGLKKYLKFKRYPCHAHSVQAIVDAYLRGHRFRGSYQVTLPREGKEVHAFRRCEYHQDYMSS